MRFIVMLSSLLLLASCNNTEKPVGEENTTTTPVEQDVEQKPEQQLTDLALFFKKDGTEAVYEGEGNEFAGYTEETSWLSDNIVQLIVDNGGVTLRKVYRITEDEISLIFNEVEDVAAFNISEANNYPSLSTILKKPLEVGQEYEEGQLTEVNATVETPYKTFYNAIVLVQETEEMTETRYYVPSYGLVKTVTEMKTDDQPFIVSSSLKEVVTP